MKVEKFSVSQLREMCEEKGIDLDGYSGYVKKATLMKLLGINVPEKKVKDPNRPNKPSGAFFQYCKDRRAEMKKLKKERGSQHKTASEQITKLLAEEWQQHKKDKNEIYEKYMNNYDKERNKYMKKIEDYKKDIDVPKRPQTYYFIFCEEYREKHPKKFEHLTVGEATKKLSEKWKEMSSNKKDRFKKRHSSTIESQRIAYEPYKVFAKKMRPKFKKEFEDIHAKGVRTAINKMVAKEWNDRLKENPNFAEKYKEKH